MAAQRCEHCDINYPAGRYRCDACGRPTTFEPQAAADENWQQQVAWIKNPPQPRDGEDASVHAWRMLRILQLTDVDGDQAAELAASSIDLHELERLRAAGCPSAIALEILR